jgi:oligosaccharide repeat unit polymerase
MYLRLGFKDPLFIVSLFYFYFAFGPVINWLFNQEIYFGIITDKIHESTLIFLSVIATICFVSFLIKPKIKFSQKALVKYKKKYPLLMIVLLLLILYTIATLGFVLPSIISQSKVEKIRHLGSGLHYNYLLLQYYIFPFYFLIKEQKTTYRLYTLNFILYSTYCLVTGERDFIFVILTIMVYSKLHIKNLQKNIFDSIFFVVKLLLLAVVGATIFILRDANAALKGSFILNQVVVQMLNQGSILFINTQIIDWIDDGMPLRYGSTYVNSVLNLLPSWIYKTDLNLLTWFSSKYAPNAPAGSYGFSLDAEAYMNFSYLGPILLFFAIATMQRLVYNQMGKHPFFIYFSVFYTGFIMYALRNDSLAFIKGSLYAVLFFFAISIFSNLKKPLYERHSNS